MREGNSDIIEFLCTLFVFIATISCIPLLLISYLVVQITHSLWISVISLRSKNIEIIRNTSLRTLVDTHRNQGILAVLLTVRGPADVQAVRRHLQEVVKRRDKLGNLAFPRLKQGLSSKWLMYAWQEVNFDLDQHLILAPLTHKGRVVTEINIQEYISEIMSKFLPVGMPPWQVFIVPSSEDQHYILVKLHHVLLTEGLNIADLLPLIPPVRSIMDSSSPKSPLTDVFRKPENIPYLEDRLMEEFTNRWNEFISTYDPLERPELMKTTPGVFQFFAAMLIATVSTVKECRKGFSMINNDFSSRLQFVKVTVKKESWKRRISFGTFVASIFTTLNPVNVVKFFIKYWWYTVTTILKTPLYVYYEIRSFISCITVRYAIYPNTLVGQIYNYVPLFFYASREFLYCLKVLFYAPIIVLKELTSSYRTIQTVTLCGRKVVAWSRPVKTSFIRNLAQATGTSDTEILLSAISDCLSRYLAETNARCPKEIPITARNINSNFIFSTGNRVRPEDSIGGMLCINLPMLGADKDRNIPENLTKIRKNFETARGEQPLIYLISMLQTKYGVLSKLLPATFISIVLKYLSRRYSVSFTELTSKQPNITQRTLWGQEVTSVIYWRPPQANISISMCVNQYAEHMVLGVMCDAQLVPHHPALAKGFLDHVQELAASVGVNET